SGGIARHDQMRGDIRRERARWSGHQREEIQRGVQVVETAVYRPVLEVEDLAESAQVAEAEGRLDGVVVRRVIMWRGRVQHVQALVLTERIVGGIQRSAVGVDRWSAERIGEASIQLVIAHEYRSVAACRPHQDAKG